MRSPSHDHMPLRRGPQRRNGRDRLWHDDLHAAPMPPRQGIPHMLLRSALFLALSTTAAVAQDADPRNQLVEGYMACMSGGGDVDLTGQMLDALMWTKTEDGDMGLVNFAPGAGDSTFIYMSDDGSFCHVESLTVDSATASEILAVTLGGEEGAPFDYSKDDMGCTRLDFETGVQATITAGGNDPTCGSDTDSGVRFTFEASE